MSLIHWRWAVAIASVLIVGAGTTAIRSRAKDVSPINWDPARAAEIPQQVGEWSMVEDIPPDAHLMDKFKRLAAIERVYSRGEGGPEVNLFLVYGDTMEAMHFPEHCLKAGGWGMGEMRSITVPPPVSGGEAAEATLIEAEKPHGRQAHEVFLFATSETTSADWLTLVWGERRSDVSLGIICMVIVIRELMPDETEDMSLGYLTEFTADLIPHVQGTLQPAPAQ